MLSLSFQFDRSVLRRLGFLLVCLLALSSGTISTIYAGLELLRLEIIPLTDRVRIEWETSSEYDIAAFQLFYKLESQAQSEYTPIGEQIPAQGELESGALYTAEFFQLQPNTSYCFQLREVPSNDEPGERFERCGYGINTRPTPPATATPTSTPIPSDTPIPTMTPFPAVLPTSPLPTPTASSIGDVSTVDASTGDGAQDEGGVGVVLQTPSAPPTYIIQTATPTDTPVVFVSTPTPLALATRVPAVSIPGFDQWFPGATSTTSLNDMLALLLCVGGIGLALLGVMTLLGTIFYLRSRM